ncbi:preprotein translocase subunit SecA [Acetobacteraceae bacterium]|nr:preprotein translocase subunit SecA [Acetobacteraceae bacterium]
MLARFAHTLFGSANDRALKNYQKRVALINGLEEGVKSLSDEDLQRKTSEFRERLKKGESLEDLQCEAFAVCREAARRILGMRHFDVQLIGGMVLHDGRIAEMRTGEGKTLVATLAVYLNALAGKGVHVVTVNDYLASRDAAEMSVLYQFLGLSTGVIVPNLSDDERRAAYHCDITYGTNNEFGFDYLRDNMKYTLQEMVQRPFFHAIVDEVDSILIDEARTPLIISGPAEDSSELYRQVDKVMAVISKDPGHYEKDEKLRTVILTESGVEAVEEALRDEGVLAGGMYDAQNVEVVHHVQQSLRAHTLFARDVDYIVRDNKVILIDEFTGRMMDGRRYSDGLHQALEAKEAVEIQKENQTLASITFQNYFRLYPKLSGMTGTAMTEANEFAEIYNLRVIEIPTNVPVQRSDSDDEIYLTEAQKFNAVANLIEEIHATGQPVLVGTTSIEKSERLSDLLAQRKVLHNVLNARHHEREASIIAQAGSPGAITIATNMAGRGTDIKLGGNPDLMVKELLKGLTEEELTEERRKTIEEGVLAQVKEAHKVVQKAGGLYVIGTERHESRRVDNQLRGRSGRQGDPGNSRFFLSLEDDLIRIFATGRMGAMMQKLGLKEGEAIIHPWLNKALEKAQKKVEARNFDMRKNTLKYDDVMNDQRKEVYAQRREYMEAENVSDVIAEMRARLIEELLDRHIPEKTFPEAWEVLTLRKELFGIFALDLNLEEWVLEDEMDEEILLSRIEENVEQAYQEIVEMVGQETMTLLEKHILLTSFDAVWKEHLHGLDRLRQGIGLRAYGQKDPLNEYKQEAFQMFGYMLDELRRRVVSSLSRVRPIAAADSQMSVEGDNDILSLPSDANVTQGHEVQEAPVLSRNALCPCGSGLKYKHCCGRVE